MNPAASMPRATLQWVGCCALASTIVVASEAPAQPRREVLVFSASSLRDVLAEARALYMQRHPDVRVRIHDAGSTVLRRQIESGAAADVFVSADPADMQALHVQGAVAGPQRIATNRLVVATASHSPAIGEPADLLRHDVRCVAVGNPSLAPVGRYTREVLAAWGMTDRERPLLQLCENARQITSALASAACDVAIAYHTDVIADARLQEVWTIADSLHAPIAYDAAPLRSAPAHTQAQAFTRFLSSHAVATILARHGFVPHAGGGLEAGPAPTQARASPDGVASRLEPLWLSMRVATLATVCSGVAGLAMATWLTRRRRGLGRDVWAALADLPLVLPPTVIGLGLLELCGPNGPLGVLLERTVGMRLAFTWLAAVLASSVMAFPLMVRTTRAALESVPWRYVEAARTLGSSPWSAFWRVQLPLARRGVVAGVVLCFFRALGEFGATLMVAGNVPGRTQTLPLAIYSAVFESQPRDAVVWVVLVLILSWSGALAAQRLARGAA